MKQAQEKGIKAKILRFVARRNLNRLVKRCLRATNSSKIAAREILYGLPAVFSMTMTAGDASVRLIKEADAFRVMETAEKSANLLTITFEDLTVLGEIVSQECTLQKALSERRLSFSGKTRYLTSFLRAIAAGDKAILPNDEYVELYGGKNEV